MRAVALLCVLGLSLALCGVAVADSSSTAAEVDVAAAVDESFSDEFEAEADEQLSTTTTVALNAAGEAVVAAPPAPHPLQPAAAQTHDAVHDAVADEEEAAEEVADEADAAADTENVESLSDDAAADAEDEAFDGDYNFLQVDEADEEDADAETEDEADEAESDESEDMAFVQTTGGALEAIEEELVREQAAAELGMSSLATAAEQDSEDATAALLESTDQELVDTLTEAEALASEDSDADAADE